MKIAYLMHGIGWGGAAGSLMLLLKGLKNYSATKYFYTSIDRENKAKKEFIRLTDYYKQIDLPQLKNDLAGGYTNIKDFERIIGLNYSNLINELIKNKIDIIHINSTVFSHVLKPIKENTSVKTVMHVREMLPKYDNGEVRNYMLKSIEDYADSIICISDNEAKQFGNKEKVCVMANPFDFDSLENIKDDFFKQTNINKDHLLIAMSGQFSPSRGHKAFLEAIYILLKKYPLDTNSIKFLVFGGAKQTPYWKVLLKKVLNKTDISYEYKRTIKNKKLSKNIITFPTLYTDDFHSMLKHIDVYVRPSLAGNPWGRDIIEAMAFGKPIIATGNSTFYVKPDKNGYLINPNEPEVMADKMYELINDKEKRKIMGENAHIIVKEKCDLNKYTHDLKKIYKQIINC